MNLSLNFSRWPKLLRWLLYLTLLGIIAAVVTYLIVASKYSKLAETYDLENINRMEEGTLVLGSKGEKIGRILIEDRLFVSLDDVPQLLKDAVIATEDSRFYLHSGIDKRGILRSAIVNLKAGGIRQGASTITQQLARHAFKLRGRTFDRKLTEIFVAKRLADRFTKDEILEHYLNRIYLGSGFYGVGSAARGYFGKKVKDLTVGQAAILAGIIKSPSRFSPFNNPDKAKHVRNLSLRRMHDLAMISRDYYDWARFSPIEVLAEEERFTRPHFALQATRRELENRFPQRLDLEGGEIYTSLDLDLTLSAIDALQDQLAKVEEDHPLEFPDSRKGRLEGAVIVLENETGNVVAAVGGREHRTSPFDRAFKAKRPPGTAFLPITYAAYFSSQPDNHFAPVLDAPLDNRTVMVGGDRGILAEWSATADEYLGNIPAPLALLRSKTSASVRIGNRTGVQDLIAIAEDIGIKSPLQPYPATFLGGSPVKLVELAQAYATIASGGQTHREVTIIKEAVQRRGTSHRNFAPSAESSTLSPEAARLTREILVARLRLPEHDAILSSHGISGTGLAGQDGSSYGFLDGWFIGFDQNHTCAVWVGHQDGESLGIPHAGLEIAMPIWAHVMSELTHGNPTGWPMSEDPSSSKVCLRSGQKCTDACLADQGAGFVRLFSHSSLEECSVHARSRFDDAPRAVVVKEGPRRPFEHRPVFPKEPVLLGIDPYRN